MEMNNPECPICDSPHLSSMTSPGGIIFKCINCDVTWPSYLDKEDARDYVTRNVWEMKQLKSYVKILVEKRIREADVTGGEKTPWGSSKHIKDLKKRIEDAMWWRNKQPKGSESRANYSRLVTKLKNELKSAIKVSEKKKTKKNDKL